MSDNVKMVAVNSSNIAQIGHDAEWARLHVQFKNGATWVYQGVESETYEQMLKAESVGKFFNAVIKPHYAAEQV